MTDSSVRAEFVDAAYRAITAHGSGVSMDDIAREAGSSKPRLYRNFADKDDLYRAVAQRMSDDIYRRVRPDFNFVLSAPRVALREAISCYADVIAANPAVFRFLSLGASQSNGRSAGVPIGIGHDIANRMAAIARDVLGSAVPDLTGVEMTVYAGVGAVLSATDQWLESAPNIDETTIAGFVDDLSPLVWGLLDGFLRHRGIALDPDQPMFVSLAALLAGNPTNESTDL